MTDRPRLIEVAFPLRQASLDSVHEKNVRHGHISTLHVWPARRPLAACRAALIATLLPAPESEEERRALVEKIGGKVVRKADKDKVGFETEGGVLHWGNENGPDMDWFRAEIRKAYGGRAPRVLDPFAGGGAIPLEAMRLGCEATAIDINPVAWFILKCTLEYPQKLAGQVRPLPKFALESREFMEAFLKGSGKASKKKLEKELDLVQQGLFPAPEVGLSWHLRAWGWWVLQKARAELARFYPVVDGKPTVAYLWARTVACKNCRAVMPLLKTRWLCKTKNKRVLLTMEPNADKTGVVFGVQADVPTPKGSPAQRKEQDKKLGAGTMSRAGATCPCCGLPSMKMEDIREEGKARPTRLGMMMTAVVLNGETGKEYRAPTEEERTRDSRAAQELERAFAEIPFGPLNEPLAGKEALGFRVPLYGITKWQDMFTRCQLLSLGTFVKHTRQARQAMEAEGYPPGWAEAVGAYLGCGIDRLVDFCNVNTQWKIDVPTINHALVRFAIQMTWDFAEGNPIGDMAGSYWLCLNRVAIGLGTVLNCHFGPEPAKAMSQSAVAKLPEADVVITDPPYYDAIPYSDLMDWFYVWLRRTVWGLAPDYALAMKEALGPKWDSHRKDGELIDDSSRHQGDASRSKAEYEDGMARVFSRCAEALTLEGRLVVVFANKQPDAWETLVSSVIRAGFVVDGSWPIQTEQPSRTRGQASAALSSSVWLVCKKRPAVARPGWDNVVLDEMRAKIYAQLRSFWDAGIRGPDFVWAATGPAMEAYSKHPVVKRSDKPGELMSVPDFLRAVRRIVVDFVVGRVLTRNGDGPNISGLDDLTTYYLLHRHDFGLDKAPIGPCILYAVSCGLSDADLLDRHDVLLRAGGQDAAPDVEEDEAEEGSDEVEEPEARSGAQVRLKPWAQRTRKGLGQDVNGQPAPLIDQAHRLMHLWKAGEVVRVDEYVDARGLRRNGLFQQVLQALIELAAAGSDERAVLESISNHLVARGVDRPAEPGLFDRGDTFADGEG